MKCPLLLPVLLCLSYFANAQMLDIGDTWIYDTRDYSIGDGHYTEQFNSITIVSDTLINDTTYFKLVASYDSPCNVFTSIEYLREANDKIYRLSDDFQTEYLMIDFGDQASYPMVYLANAFRDTISTIVTNQAIDIISLPSGNEVNVMYQLIENNSSFNDDQTYTLSREIGYISPSFLFPDIGTGLCDTYLSINLRCKVSGEDTIRLTELDCYESSLTSDVNTIIIDDIEIYPNPTNGELYIKGDISRAYLHDIFGNKLLNSATNNLHIGHLPTGTYLLTVVKQDGSSLTQKVIVH